MEPGRHNFTIARRGLTFIETVCAVAMLGMISASLLGAFNSMINAQARQRHKLAAMELANRLILQYLDDSDTMPPKTLPIEYDNERYRWELKEIPVQLIPARADVAEDRTNATAVSVNRMQAIAVNVWLSEESGGSMTYDVSVPAATLTRLMDPIALRNPDTTKYLAKSATKQRELLERFQRIGRNAGGGKPKPAVSPTVPSDQGGKPAPSPGPLPRPRPMQPPPPPIYSPNLRKPAQGGSSK